MGKVLCQLFNNVCLRLFMLLLTQYTVLLCIAMTTKYTLMYRIIIFSICIICLHHYHQYLEHPAFHLVVIQDMHVQMPFHSLICMTAPTLLFCYPLHSVIAQLRTKGDLFNCAMIVTQKEGLAGGTTLSLINWFIA